MKHELTEIQKHRFDRLIKAVGGGVEYKDKPVFFDIAMWFKHYGRSIQMCLRGRRSGICGERLWNGGLHTWTCDDRICKRTREVT